MISLATKRAKQSVFKYKVGAVIVKGGCVLGTGFNKIKYKNHKYPKKDPVSLHAEQAAILNIIKRNKLHSVAGSTLFVSRILSNGNTALAKPCAICMELIKSTGVRKIVYTTAGGTESQRV